MNKPIAVLAWTLLATCALGAAPAHAETTTGSSVGGDAFGYRNEKLRRGNYRYRVTTWSVFVYRATDGNFLDVSRDVRMCKGPFNPEPQPAAAPNDRTSGPRGCVLQSSQSGMSDQFPQDAFTLAEDTFSAGHLDAFVDLQTFDKKGRPSGPPAATRVVVDWTGIGDPTHTEGTYRSTKGQCDITDEFVDDFRDAAAVGTLGGEPLGDSATATLGKSSFTHTQSEGCPDEVGPASAQRHRGE